jgi:hypothetical protein
VLLSLKDNEREWESITEFEFDGRKTHKLLLFKPNRITSRVDLNSNSVHLTTKSN